MLVKYLSFSKMKILLQCKLVLLSMLIMYIELKTYNSLFKVRIHRITQFGQCANALYFRDCKSLHWLIYILKYLSQHLICALTRAAGNVILYILIQCCLWNLPGSLHFYRLMFVMSLAYIFQLYLWTFKHPISIPFLSTSVFVIDLGVFKLIFHTKNVLQFIDGNVSICKIGLRRSPVSR